MTVTLRYEKSISGKVKSTLELEKYGCYSAHVYEEIGGDWRETHRSNPTKDEAKAKQAFYRFTRNYVRNAW